MPLLLNGAIGMLRRCFLPNNKSRVLLFGQLFSTISTIAAVGNFLYHVKKHKSSD